MNKHYFNIIFLCLCMASFDGFSHEQWTQKANFGGIGRHRTTGFSIGNKGYIGGGHINSGTSTYHEDYWQYDPTSDSWTQIADFGGGKRYHSSAFTIDGFGYVGLGEDDDDNYHNDFYRYVPQLNIWQAIASYPGNPRRGASSFVINSEGYVGCGQSDFGYQNDFYKYIPEDNEWYTIEPFLGEARSSAVGFSHDGKGYVGTGHIFGDDTKDFYEYDPFSNSWTQKADVGTTNRQDATGFVVNGHAYLGTGNDVDANFNFKDFWQYDFELDEWTQFNDFGGEGRRYMVSFVIGERAYAGTGTDGTNLRDFWAFDPLLSTTETDLVTTTIYPNPSTDEIKVNTQLTTLDFKVYNTSGQVVWQESESIDRVVKKSDVGKGSFLLQISSDDVIVTKLIEFL